MHPLQVEVRRNMAVLKISSDAATRAWHGLDPASLQPLRRAQSSRSFGLKVRLQLVTQGFSRQLANVLVALLTPAAVVALVMALWRVCADLGWAGAFLIADGFFSHWQVWIALSIGLKMLSSTLIAWGSRTSKFSEEN